MTDDPHGDVLTAPLTIEYPFKRTTGPVVGAFLTALREGFLVGIKGSDGRVLVPPTEYDPMTGEDLTEVVEVGPAGTVTTWAWVRHPGSKAPVDRPFAWALIRPDGADTALLGAVDAGAIGSMATGMKVEPVWAEEREGSITDITCWTAVAG
ncbi:MAG: OB-fold domain-containing protein [Acidimicrobiia bacterium]|nr:OB-fold domain-containing protein [Acidimicrobiia bacterium]